MDGGLPALARRGNRLAGLPPRICPTPERHDRGRTRPAASGRRKWREFHRISQLRGGGFRRCRRRSSRLQQGLVPGFLQTAIADARRALAALDKKLVPAEAWLDELDHMVSAMDELRTEAPRLLAEVIAERKAAAGLRLTEPDFDGRLARWRTTSDEIDALATRVRTAALTLNNAALEIEVLIRALPPSGNR